MSEIAVAEPGTRLQNFLDRDGLRGFPWKTATILYTISWGWLFIVRESLWADDWARVRGDLNFRGAGLAPWLKYELDLFHLLGLTGIRTLIFLTFFLSGLAMFGISSRISILDYSQRKFFILLFIILPFNTARVALQSFHYTIAYVLFFVAWYLIINFHPRALYCLSLVLFFFSFGMHSLLPFYILPVIHLFFLEEIKSLQTALGWIRRNIVLIMLPLIYWTIRNIFWPEDSLYHDITASRVYRSASFPISISILLLIFYQIQRRFTTKRHGLRIVMVGIFSMSMGILAYVVHGFFKSDWSFSGKYLTTFLGRSDWYSRHQILQPLGAALVTVGVIELISKFRRNKMKQLQILILSICVVINIGFGFEYAVDYSKQKVVISELKRIGDDKAKSATQFVDQTTLLNARGHTYRPWDWSGMIWRAYDSELQYGTDVVIETSCSPRPSLRLVLIQGPETHWQALKNWVSDGDMGFKVTVDDMPGACKPEMVTAEKVSGAIPILFYFIGAKG